MVAQPARHRRAAGERQPRVEVPRVATARRACASRGTSGCLRAPRRPRARRRARRPSRRRASARSAAPATRASSFFERASACGPACDELRTNFSTRASSSAAGHAFVHEADALRLARAQALARQHVAARLLLAHRAHEVRADHRGHEADAHLGQAELGSLGGDHEVAGRHEAHAARERGAVHARDQRLRIRVHAVRAASRSGRLRVFDLALVICGRLLHAREVAAGAERLRRAPREPGPGMPGSPSSSSRALEQRRSRLVVERVAQLRPVQPQPGGRAAPLDLDHVHQFICSRRRAAAYSPSSCATTSGDRLDRIDLAHALARAPDVAPDLLLGAAAGAEVHLAGIGLRQVERIEAGRDDAVLQVVAVHAGKKVRVDDVRGGGAQDLLLVAVGTLASGVARKRVPM